MSVLSWGKCLIETTPSVNGAPASNASWLALDTPKEGTTQLTPTAGQETTANEEGGEIVDARSGKTTFTLEFDLFVKKGGSRPFVDDDGVISGEHAFRVTPLEDAACEGIQIDRSTLRVEESYNTADGKMLHYVARCLKPATGKTVKPYTKGGFTVTPSALYFSAEEDSTGKTVTAGSTNNIEVSSPQSWITVTAAGKVATVKVSANESGAPREGVVNIVADGTSAVVSVLQIP